MAQVLHYPIEYYVWADETGSYRRDHMRQYGYQLRGLTPTYHRFLIRGTRVSTIAAISYEGLVNFKILTGTTNGDIFLEFLVDLISNMQSFPAPRSVVIMDNYSIHHIQPVKYLLNAVGIPVVFLPPHSPDYNPCEEMFSDIKYYQEDHDEILQYTDFCSYKYVLGQNL